MTVGDCVCLKQPFSPSSASSQAYRYGIVAGVVSDDLKTEVLIYLYDPDNDTIYTDEFDAQAIYQFRPEELK